MSETPISKSPRNSSSSTRSIESTQQLAKKGQGNGADQSRTNASGIIDRTDAARRAQAMRSIAPTPITSQMPNHNDLATSTKLSATSPKKIGPAQESNGDIRSRDVFAKKNPRHRELKKLGAQHSAGNSATLNNSGNSSSTPPVEIRSNTGSPLSNGFVTHPSQSAQKKRNGQQAKKSHLEKQADNGDHVAQYCLAQNYRTGNGVKKDEYQYAKWLVAAAEAGYEKAKSELTLIERRGPVSLLEKLGRVYDTGDVLETTEAQYKNNAVIAAQIKKKNDKQEQAVHWYELAARQDSAHSKCWLAMFYYRQAQRNASRNLRQKGDRTQQKSGNEKVKPLDVDRFYAKAIDLAKSASDQGSPSGYYLLGFFHEHGIQRPSDEQTPNTKAEDLALALEYYQGAAEKGLADAQYKLGFMYFSGQGVKPDIESAVDYFRQAAEQEHPAALNALGYCLVQYWSPVHPRVDPNELEHYFSLAAEQGNADAQYNLAIYYLNRCGSLKKNADQAARLLGRAAAQGHQRAKSALKDLSNRSKNENADLHFILQDNEKIHFFSSGVRGNESPEYQWPLSVEYVAEASPVGSSMSANGSRELGVAYINRLSGAGNNDERLGVMQSFAEMGWKKAQSDTVSDYYYGLHGAKKDYGVAAKWLVRCALVDHAGLERFHVLDWSLGDGWPYDKISDGIMSDALESEYATRLASAQTDTDAVRVKRRFAEIGYADAQYDLALAYKQGKADVKDADFFERRGTQETVIAKWMAKAAIRGHKEAQRELDQIKKAGNADQLLMIGRVYDEEREDSASRNKRSVLPRKEEAAEAFDCFRRAALQGHAGAEHRLSCAYGRGTYAVGKNREKATEFLVSAALKGYGLSQTLIRDVFNDDIFIDPYISARFDWVPNRAEVLRELKKGCVERFVNLEDNCAEYQDLRKFFESLDKVIPCDPELQKLVLKKFPDLWPSKSARHNDRLEKNQFFMSGRQKSQDKTQSKALPGWYNTPSLIERRLLEKRNSHNTESEAVVKARSAAHSVMRNRNEIDNLEELLKIARGGTPDEWCAVGQVLAKEDSNSSLSGNRGEIENERALIWLQRAALENHADAQYELAKLLRGGSEKELKEQALDWCQCAALNGNLDAQMALVQQQIEPSAERAEKFFNSVKRRATRSANSIFREGDGGNPEAQYQMALLHMTPYSLEEDSIEAAKWLVRARQQDHQEAKEKLRDIWVDDRSASLQYVIGRTYLKDDQGIQAQPEKARRWLRRAVENGHPLAQAALNNEAISAVEELYQQAREALLRNEVNKAERTFIEAALAGHPTATEIVRRGHDSSGSFTEINSALGNAYETALQDAGDHISKKLACYIEFERLGYPKAIFDNGCFWRDRPEPNRDVDHAQKLFVRAAGLGYQPAIDALAAMGVAASAYSNKGLVSSALERADANQQSNADKVVEDNPSVVFDARNQQKENANEDANRRTSLAALRSNAHDGDKDAQYKLSQYYFKKAGNDSRIMRRAARWLLRSMSEPNPCLAALKELEEIKRNGSARLQFEIAKIYQSGLPEENQKSLPAVPHNKQQALFWYKAAAGHDNLPATFIRKVAQTVFEAGQHFAGTDLGRNYYQFASLLGHSTAQYSLGNILLNSHKNRTDRIEGASWLVRAHVQGKNDSAEKKLNKLAKQVEKNEQQFVIAEVYRTGLQAEGRLGPLAPQPGKAKFWYECALKHGRPEAAERLKELAAQKGGSTVKPNLSMADEIGVGSDQRLKGNIRAESGVKTAYSKDSENEGKATAHQKRRARRSFSLETPHNTPIADDQNKSDMFSSEKIGNIVDGLKNVEARQVGNQFGAISPESDDEINSGRYSPATDAIPSDSEEDFDKQVARYGPVARDILRASAQGDDAALAKLNKFKDGGNAVLKFAIAKAYHEDTDSTYHSLEDAYIWYESAAYSDKNQVSEKFSTMLNAGTFSDTGRNDLAQSIELLKESAEQNPNAQYTLALRYLNGDGVPKDTVQAAFWLARSAAKGHAPSRNQLRMLKNTGDPALKFALSEIYKRGFGRVRANLTKAESWNQLSVPPTVNTLLALGDGYFAIGNKRSAKEYYLQAIDKGANRIPFNLKVIAKGGDAELQSQIGDFYHHGAGRIKPNFDKAAEWYLRAKKSGDVNGAARYGLYRLCNERKIDAKKAQIENKGNLHKHLKDAAECHHPEAEYELACYFMNSEPVNTSEAAKYLVRAESHGSSQAKKKLESIAVEGPGALQFALYEKENSKARALDWLVRAAENKHSDAEKEFDQKKSREDRCLIGDIYRIGITGVEKNPEKAIDWYQRAQEEKGPGSRLLPALGLAEVHYDAYRNGGDHDRLQAARESLEQVTNMVHGNHEREDYPYLIKAYGLLAGICEKQKDTNMQEKYSSLYLEYMSK